MIYACKLIALLVVGSTTIQSVLAQSKIDNGMVKVGPGTLRPFYPATPKQKEVAVAAFSLDRLPVTNGDFLAFVKSEPKWQRGRLTSLFADKNYLSHWQQPLKLGPNSYPKQPVVFISWFAAKAYCKARGKRLPTEEEWEFAALATETTVDGSKDPIWRKRILDWYARPNPKELAHVGKSPANFWGVYNLHGLIWEWVLEFNSTMFSVDNRSEGDANKIGFCGSGSLSASEKEDYASFMRIAFRSSLEANYTTANLGFRCAKDYVGAKYENR